MSRRALMSFADAVDLVVRARLAGSPLPDPPALWSIAPPCPAPHETPWNRPYLGTPRELCRDVLEGACAHDQDTVLVGLCAVPETMRHRVVDAAASRLLGWLPTTPAVTAVAERLRGSLDDDGESVGDVADSERRHLTLVFASHSRRAARRHADAAPLLQRLRADLVATAFSGHLRFEGAWIAAHDKAFGPLVQRRLARRQPDPLAQSGTRALLARSARVHLPSPGAAA